jgi:signal transduction histidine kinase
MEPGYELRFADNGKAALETVETFNPSLVILDIMMPGMNGYDVCRLLKSDKKTASTMVLLLSGKDNIGDRLKGYEVEADDYMTKPYDPEELRAKAEILLRLKNVQDDLLSTNQNLEKIVAVKTRALVRKERQALVGQMIQGIVHNLRSPVTVVGGMAELATRKLAELSEKCPKDEKNELCKVTEKIHEYLRDIVTASHKIESIISNLLVKSRKEAVSDKQNIDLNDLLRKELEFLDADMEIKHGLQKTLNLDQNLPEIYGTYTDFSQVCYNMIKNASDAMRCSPKKEIIITTRHDNNFIYIEFHDTGSGIDPEHIDHIFDPFFTTKPLIGTEEEGESAGTGLGLYTCTQLLEAYGAKIHVKSELNIGTTFCISIPLHNIERL